MQPVMAIIMETEIWPNIFHHCAQRKIPTVLANARMSARSAAGYRKLGKFMQGVMGTIDVVAAQSQDDAARLIGLGVKPDHMHVIGSVKFDVHIPASLKEQAEVLRRDWGVERSIWIAASTRQGEEETILDAYAHIKYAQPDALLVLVPRHPERFDGVANLCEKRGFNLVRRSEHRGCDSETDIYLGDSMGELPLFYAASDIAFIGGSLVPAGGQNPIEAAALGLPIVIGPSFYNFTEIGRMLRESEAVCVVKDSEQLAASVVDCFRDPNLRHQRGENAKAVVQRNRGAMEKLLRLIDELK
jgi:3-deoxy-D-manno-octulosonic-acid transferase